MSSKSKPKSEKPKSEKSKPAAPGPKPSVVVPNLSYCALFLSSPRTEAASLISLNLSAASESVLFMSG